MIKKLYLISFIFFFLLSCQAQDNPTPEYQKKLTEQFLILPQTQVINIDSLEQIGIYLREIHEDQQGNLWFGTLERGLAMYDGKKLQYFSKRNGLADNQVNGITEDKDGLLWISTTNGISSYDGTTFKTYRTSEGLQGNSTWSIMVDKTGKVWIGTVNGISVFDGKSFSEFKLPASHIKNTSSRFDTLLAWTIMEDHSGNIWFGTDDNGLYKYDGKGFEHFTQKDGLSTNNITNIMEDNKGNIWIGSRQTRIQVGENKFHYEWSENSGLDIYDGKKIKSIKDEEGLVGHDIGPIYQDKSGDIWIAAKHHGVYKYDGKKFTNFMDDSGVARYNCAQSFLKDNKGNMWIGFSGGLFKLEENKLKNIKKNYFIGC